MRASLVLGLALACLAAQAVADNPMATLKANGLTSLAALAEVAGASAALSASKARVTLLAPSNAAIDTFLADMGLTLDELKANPTLAKAILGYHVVLGVAAGPAELFAKGDKVKVATAVAPFTLTFNKAGDAVTVTDTQGNVAKVMKANLGSANHQVHVVDKVLYSGSYWKSLADVVKRYPKGFSTVAAAADKAGLLSTLTSAKFADTVFLPTNDAFTKAGIDVTATPEATLADVLKYHVVAGHHPIPSGFTSGEAVKTLQGQDITVTYKAKGNGTSVATVTDASGKTAEVVHPNIFIRDAEVHVIDGVLMPKAAAAAAAPVAAAPVTAAPVTAAPVAASASSSAASAGKGMPKISMPSMPKISMPTMPSKPTNMSKPTISLPRISMPTKPNMTMPSMGKGSISVKISVSSSPMPKPSPSPKPASTGKGGLFSGFSFGRKMLQSTIGYAGDFEGTIALDSTEQAILSAVNNAASAASVSGATGAGIANTELETAFPVNPTYADGILGADDTSAGGGGN